MVECDDHTETGLGYEDYWGTDEDGSEWRVYVVTDRQKYDENT